MTKLFNLDFHEERFTVPKLSLFNLFEHQRDLFDATSYNVQSSVSVEIFKVFVNALKTGTNVPVTKENSGPISLLAKEFWLEDLLAECSALQVDSAVELIAALSERSTQVEHQLSSQVPAIVPELKESITNHERQLESLLSVIEAKPAILRTEIDDLRQQFAQLLQTELEAMNSKCEKQNETRVARIASVERKISDSLSSITSRLTVCERSIVPYGTQMNEVRASVEEMRTKVGGIDVRRRHRHSTANSGADPNPETPTPRTPIPDSVRPVSPSPVQPPIQPVRIYTPAPVPVRPVFPHSQSKQSSFRSSRPNHLRESFHILLGNTGEMFTRKELSQLLQSRFMIIPSSLWGISLISILTRISAQRTSQVSGFAGISDKCASVRLITRSELTI
jgi:hypothetical protein